MATPFLFPGLGLAANQPTKHRHAQSLLDPPFHDPRMHHVLESHPEWAAPLSCHDDEHAVSSYSALALHLYLAACNQSSSCSLWVLDHLCSNLSQPRANLIPFASDSCWISETRSLNLFVYFYIFLFCFCFSDRNGLQLWVSVCNLVAITTAIPLLLLP